MAYIRDLTVHYDYCELLVVGCNVAPPLSGPSTNATQSPGRVSTSSAAGVPPAPDSQSTPTRPGQPVARVRVSQPSSRPTNSPAVNGNSSLAASSSGSSLAPPPGNPPPLGAPPGENRQTDRKSLLKEKEIWFFYHCPICMQYWHQHLLQSHWTQCCNNMIVQIISMSIIATDGLILSSMEIMV